MKNSLSVLFSIIIVNGYLFSQENITQQEDTTTFIQKNIKITGDVGVYGELYSIKGQQGRRPKSTGRIFIRPTISLFNLINIPFEFLISSEGSSARQNINQFGINPTWDWGNLHLGDFTEDYSQFTLSGINIRGLGLNLTPGNFRFSTSSGFTQRSVSGGAQDGSFKRFLFAAKLGYGSEESTYVDLIFLRAKDEIGSLDQNEKSITVISPNGNDILEIGSLQSIKWNSFGITGGIKIELSRDGGNSFELISDAQPNVGFYNYTVTGPAAFQCIIKVSSSADSSISDVSDFTFTIGSGVTSQIASNYNNIINNNAFTPQENLILGSKGKITFLENKVSFEFDGGGSVFTRDVRSQELNVDSSDVPAFLSKIYRIRVGSNYDFAFNTSLNLNFQNINSKIGYKRIGPGYNSLGASYTLNDIQEFSAMNSIRISSVGLTIGYIHQSDNLIKQKLFTTGRDIISLSAAAMLTQNWSGSLSFNMLNMSNDADSQYIKTDFSSLVLGTTQTFIIDPQGIFRNINFNYSYQSTNNKSYLLNNNKTAIHSLNIGSGIGLSENFSANISAGFINSSIFDTTKTTTQNYALIFQHNGFTNRLNSTANISAAFSEENSAIRLTIGSGYQLSIMDNISISISYLKFKGNNYKGSNFDEVLSSLNYSHRF